MNIVIPPYAWHVIDRLNRRGYEAYAVGGCVRDALLGIKAKDWDVCTNATPQEILGCFADMRTVPTGIQHGTITVISDDTPVEVTTYRIDGSYSDSRHPDGVVFTPSLQEDLARRDFTVNALAYHPAVGLVDLYNGREDILRKVLRCVGDPAIRLQEDALRILRGLRFASVLGFDLAHATVVAMEQKTQMLAFVAKERVYQELTKLLCGIGAKGIVENYGHILCAVLPFMEAPIHLCEGFGLLPKEPAVRYAALYQKNGMAGRAMEQLRAPAKVVHDVATIQAMQKEPLPTALPQVRNMVYRYGMALTESGLHLMEADGMDGSAAKEYLKQIEKQQLCCCLKDLAITGRDLQQAGYTPGPQLGLLLETLLFAVMEERVANQPADLLAYAEKI